MKQPIKPEDIQRGDLIRYEYANEYDEAYEIRAGGQNLDPGPGTKLFLLDRPVPPFEPYWGMVIVNPQNEERAVYVPDGKYDHSPWLATVDGLFNDDAETDSWAKQKLAEGWVVIEKPEGVQ